jgi:Tfp pilus assembly major pilin PilA
MPIFDIDYNQRVPGVVQGPRANTNVDTGAGEIGRAVAGFGGALFEVGQKIQVAQDAMELSILNRQGEEMDVATEQQLMKITDADEAQKYMQDYEQKRASIAAKANSRVQNAYQINYNNSTWYRQRRFASVNLQARAKDAEDKGRYAYETAINAGSELEARKINQLRLATGTIGKSEFDSLEASLPVDIKFAQAGKLLATNPVEADRMMSDPEFLKTLNADQTKQALNLQYDARKRTKSDIEDYSQKYWQLLQSGDFQGLKTQLSDPNNPLPVEGDGGKNWWMNLAQRREEDLNQTDPAMQSKILDSVIFEPNLIVPQDIRNRAGLGIHGGLSLDKVKEYEEKYQMVLDKNSALNTPLAKTMFGELKNAQQDRAFSIDKDQNDVRYGQSLDSLSDYFINYRKKNGKDPTLAETQEYYQNLTSGYRTPERPFTEAKVQQTLGELASGGSVSIFGTVMPFSKPEDAVNHVLRNLGPNWQKVAPEAAKIIKEKWPKANIEVKQTLPAKQDFEKGERKRAPNGGLYEFTGLAGDKAWKLVKE